MKETKYKQQTEIMIHKFEEMLNDTSIQWNSVVSSDVNVYQKSSSDYCFKVETELPSTSATCFELFHNIEKRKDWDEMVDEIRLVTQIDPQTRILYLRMKPVWPTSARDVVLLAYSGKHNGNYVNITQSISYPECPEYKGIIRMDAFAGQICYDEGEKCSIIQIADGNPKGWIPASVIKVLATKTIPKSFGNIREILLITPSVDPATLFVEGTGEMESVVESKDIKELCDKIFDKLEKLENELYRPSLVERLLPLLTPAAVVLGLLYMHRRSK